MLPLKNSIETLNINGYKISVIYIFSTRKSLLLTLKNEDTIEVKVPRFISIKRAREFVLEKKAWIIKKREKIIKIPENQLYFLGHLYQILKSDCENIHFHGENIIIPISYSVDKISNWYKNQSSLVVNELYQEIIFEKQPQLIKVKKQKKRYGSCTSKGNIYINSHISMCPKPVITYILYHELCHLIHMNHSKDFYYLLKKYCPDYKKHKEWLKNHSLLLNDNI